MFGPLIWSLVNATATVLIPFLLFIVFARTGEVWQVGVVGIAVSILEILKTFCPMGLYEILLRPETTQEEERSSLALLLLSGAAATIVFLILVILIGRNIANAESIVPVLCLLAPKLLFDVAAVQPQAALARQLSFRRLAMRTVIANTAAATIGSALAFSGHALTGLILYYVLQSVLSFILVAIGISSMVGPAIGLGPLRTLFAEAGYSSAVRIVAAANTYADTLVVSSFMSTSLVGTYNLSKRFETVLLSMSSSFSAIMYQPLFARRGVEARAAIVENAVRITTLLFGLPVILFVSYQKDWIGWIFGSRWIDAAPVCALLALSGLARVYGGIHGSLMSVSGRNSALLAYALGSAVVSLGSVALLSSHGLVWVAAAITLKSWAFCLLSAYLTRRETGRVVSLYLRHVLIPLLWFTSTALAAPYAVAYAAPTGVAGIPPAAVAIGLGAAVALIPVMAIYRREVVRLVKASRKNITSTPPVRLTA